MIENKTVADLVLDEIERLGTEVIFLVPGANSSFFLERARERKELKMVIANHELAAGFMAIGYARTSRKPGVVCTIGSPGLAYAVAAGMTAKADNVPLLHITGNIPESQWGKGFFQDGSPQGTNDTAILHGTTGTSLVCHQPQDIAHLLSTVHQNLSVLKPVHLQLPIDIQMSHCSAALPAIDEPKKTFTFNDFDLDTPQRIVLLLGYKASAFIDASAVRAFVEQYGIAVITDIKARGIVNESSIHSLGYIGFTSSHRAVEALDGDSPYAADHLLVVDMDKGLQERYVNAKMKSTQISVDAFKSWLDDLSIKQANLNINERIRWLGSFKKIDTYKQKPVLYSDKVSYSDLLSACKEILPEESVYCLDSGQIRRSGNMMLQASSLHSIIQSDSIAPMGSGICAAIGAKFAMPQVPVVALFGDGAMRMHGMELATAKRYNLPIIFILCDNESYATTPGDVSLKKLPASRWDLFAESFGVESFLIESKDEFVEQLTQVLTYSEPVLLWTKVPDLLDDEIEFMPVKADANWLTELKK